MSEADPFRPYSERAREARLQAAMGSTRPQPRATQPPMMVQSSRSYYPGMRLSQHPNANTAQARRSAAAGGMGMMGPHRCTTGRAGTIAGGAAHGR